jgi:hypothetical protein
MLFTFIAGQPSNDLAFYRQSTYNYGLFTVFKFMNQGVMFLEKSRSDYKTVQAG